MPTSRTPPPTPERDTLNREAIEQLGRSARLVTPLGPNVLGAVRFEGTEGLSELFEFTVDAVSERVSLDFDRAIGEQATLVLGGNRDLADIGDWEEWDDDRERARDREREREAEADPGLGDARRFSGILVNVRWLGVENDYYLYRLTLRPWLWLLSRTTDCRLFHEKDVPTIIREVFGERGFTDFELRLSEKYVPREYCVQYCETDLDFVLRLMEEEGIYFYFEHTELKHTLICVDAKSAHQTIVAAPVLMFQPRVISGRSDRDTIFDLTSTRQFAPGKVTLNDYDYMKPPTRMVQEYAKRQGHGRGDMEVYDYPGRYVEADAGAKFARVRLEAAQAVDKRRHAVGSAVGVKPGGLTRVIDHPEASENIEYLVLRCEHTFRNQGYRSVATPDDAEPYSGRYEFLPSDIPFRAEPTTKPPRILGPQTALVVGADGSTGEEIDVDKYGRILVQFYWDRRKIESRRVRIAQTWAAKSWGSMVIPRIGQEVVVEFLGGDPDQPLVTGAVYNAQNMPPYELPANQTKSGFKSNSSKGGGGFNELSFDDKKGSEKVEFHAQKDVVVTILDSTKTEVGKQYSGSGASRETTLKLGDDKLKLDTGSQIVDIAVDQKTTAKQNIKLEANMSIELTCGGSTIKMTPAKIEITAGVVEVKASAKADINGGAMMTLKAGMININ